MMPFPKRSVRSNSNIVQRDFQLRYYQKEEESSGGVLHSSWIRRLLKPLPLPPPFAPIQPTQVNPSSLMAPTALNSPCKTRSVDAAIFGNSNTPSTRESRAPTSLLTQKALFHRRFLNLRKGKPHLRTKILPPLRTDRETCFDEGFGPFQAKKRSRLVDLGVGSSLAAHSSSWGRLQGGLDVKDVGHDGIGDMRLDRHNGTVDLGEVSRNSNGAVGFPTLQSITGENFIRSESNFINNINCAERPERVFPVVQRRVADDHPSVPVSAFFQYLHALKKNDYPTEDRSNGFTGSARNDSLITKHPCPLRGESRFPSTSRAPSVAGDQSLYKQCPSVGQWPMTKAFHDNNYHSRSGGIIHCSSDDGAANSLSLDRCLTRQNARLQHERQTPAYPSEIEEPLSFWNISSFKRSKMVSSDYQVCRSGSRKRISETDEFLSLKSQKLGPVKKQLGWPFAHCI